VIDKEDSPFALVSMRDRSLGKDCKGVLYPVDDDDMGGGLLLDLLGSGEQSGLVQNTPP
jgi:hypothetical protein